MSDGRWADAPRTVYGLQKTHYNRFVPWVAKGGLDRFVQDVCTGRRSSLPGAHRLLDRERTLLCLRSKRRQQSQTIGRSPGGRTTNINAHTDRFCRPLAFLLTWGPVAGLVLCLWTTAPPGAHRRRMDPTRPRIVGPQRQSASSHTKGFEPGDF